MSHGPLAAVLIFAIVVAVSLRKGHKRIAQAPPPVRQDPTASIENPQGGTFQRTEHGKTTFSLKFADEGSTREFWPSV